MPMDNGLELLPICIEFTLVLAGSLGQGVAVIEVLKKVLKANSKGNESVYSLLALPS
jgi:hypothetical protein